MKNRFTDWTLNFLQPLHIVIFNRPGNISYKLMFLKFSMIKKKTSTSQGMWSRQHVAAKRTRLNREVRRTSKSPSDNCGNNLMDFQLLDEALETPSLFLISSGPYCCSCSSQDLIVAGPSQEGSATIRDIQQGKNSTFAFCKVLV